MNRLKCVNRSLRMRIVLLLTVFSLAIFLIAACVPVTPEPAAESGGMTEDSGAQSQVEEENSVDVPKPTSNPLVNQAINDLAQQLAVSADDIRILSVESVVWPDSALGCPQPDMMYMQVLQDGARIRLQVADTVYQYNSGGATAPFLCRTPQEPVSATPMAGF